MSGDVITTDGNAKRLKGVGPISLTITAKDADDAAKAIGLRVVKSKLLESHAILGKFVEQTGAVAISRGMFLMSAEQAQEAADKCSELINEAPDMESKIALVKAHQGYMKLAQDAAKELAAASQIVTLQKQGPPPPPPPGVIVNAENVTISEQKP